MLIRSIPIINAYVDALSNSLQSIKPSAQLTNAQKATLAFIIIGIIVTESLNWAAFERRGLNKVKSSTLHWFMYSAKVYWHNLLEASTRHILSQYGISSGTLVLMIRKRNGQKEPQKLMVSTR